MTELAQYELEGGIATVTHGSWLSLYSLDPEGTLIAIIELSLSSWLVAGTLPGVPPGTYYLTCSVHPDMTLKVIVIP